MSQRIDLRVCAVDLHDAVQAERWLALLDHYARDPMGGKDRLCTHCVIVFVALDGVDGKPSPVPPLTQETEEDRRFADYALKVMELSKGIEQAIERYRQADIDNG